MRSQLIGLLIVWLIAATAVVADEDTTVERSLEESDLRLLEVTLDKYVMDEILASYQIQDRIMVPFGALCEILGFAIDVHPDTAIAEGFILKENRRFFLDVGRRQVTVSGEEILFPAAAVIVDINDIYIDADLISQWLPVRLDIDLFILEAKVYPKELLPLQLRMERERRIERTRMHLLPEDPGYQRHTTPYALWSMPSIDQNIQFKLQRDPLGVETRGLHYTTYASADLLHMESSWYLAGSDNDVIEEHRIKLGRKDPYENLLGPLHATEFAVGHIEGAPVDLVTSSKLPQLGLLLSNYSLRQQNQFDSHSFRGELPPGWEVELYHNNALLDYQQAGTSGQYSFENTPLLFGNNFFRLVFYGPQGQVREEHASFILDESLMRAGEQRYQLSINQDDDNNNHRVLNYNYGVGKYFSSQFSLTSIPIDRVEHHYQSLGLRGFGVGLLYGVNAVNDSAGGSVNELFMQTRLGPINLSLRDAKLNNFVSEVFPLIGEPLERHSQLRIDAAIPPSFLPRIPVTLEVIRDEFESGNSETRIRNRLMAQRSGFAVGNDFIWSLRSGQPTFVNGNLMLSQFVGSYSVRGDIYYKVKPESEIGAAIFSYNSQYFAPYNLKLGVSRSFIEKHNQYTAELNKKVDGYFLGLAAAYDTTGNTSLQLTWTMNFGREPRTPYWQNSIRPFAGRGAVSARAFLDKDRDGVVSQGDQPLEGVGFTLGNGYRVDANRTDANGVAFIPSIPPYQPLNIKLAAHTLDDPLWTPAVEGWKIVPRPGHPIQLDFPVLETGEVDGTIYMDYEGQSKGLTGVTIELINRQDQVVATTRSSFDGYYVISNIPMGEYRLRIVPKSEMQFVAKTLKAKAVEFSSEQQFFYDLDFHLQKHP